MRRLFTLLLCLFYTTAFAAAPSNSVGSYPKGFTGSDGFGQAGFAQYTGPGAIASGTLTPIFGTVIAVANTNTYYGGFSTQPQSLTTGITTTNGIRQVPIPVAGTLKGLACQNTGTISGGTGGTVTFVKNGTVGSTACTLPTGNSGGLSDSIATCDLAQWQYNPHGGTWTANFLFQSAVLQSSTPNQVPILSAPTSTATVVSTTTFFSLGAIFGYGTDVAASAIMPAGQVQGLCAYPNGNDTGTNQHTFTVWHNGATSGMACTDASNGLGCCTNVTGTGMVGGSGSAACTTASGPVSVSAGDTISVRVDCVNGAGSCATINPAFGILWVPSVTNQVPLLATSNNPPSFPAYYAMDDSTATNTRTSNDGWQIAPAGITSLTFDNLIACTQFASGAGNTREFQPEYSTTLIAPVTAMTQKADLTGATTSCPASSYLTGLGWTGGVNGTGSTTVSSGSTFNTKVSTTAGSPVAGTLYKVSQTVVVAP